MHFYSDEEFQRRIDQFMGENAPQPTSYLQRLRPHIVNFLAEGYSRAAMFKGFTEQQLIACSRSAFYRWIDANIDLEKETRALLEVQSSPPKKQDHSGLVPTNEKSARQEEHRPQALYGRNGTPVQPLEVGESDSGNGVKQPVTSPNVPVAVDSSSTTIVLTPDEERKRAIAHLNAVLEAAESKSMGAVSDRALARLAERDRERAAKDSEAQA